MNVFFYYVVFYYFSTLHVHIKMTLLWCKCKYTNEQIIIEMIIKTRWLPTVYITHLVGKRGVGGGAFEQHQTNGLDITGLDREEENG